MSQVLFFTKPGCKTGIKQMELLTRSGHDLEVRSILTHPWTGDELRSYFGDLAVREWFNPNAPRITSGELDPAAFDEAAALAAMVGEPLLIRRPLLQVGEERMCGFDVQRINDWIGLAPDAVADPPDLRSCSGKTPQDCAP